MADHTVGATGTYASIQAALDDGGVSSGDTLLLQAQAHSGTGNASITSAKNITIRPQTDPGTPSFSSGARIICDQDDHIFAGYTGTITLIALAVQSNTDSGTSGFDGSNEVIRMDNAITFTATRCKFRMTAIADGTDEGDFTQCDAAGTFVFENCEFSRFDRKVISTDFTTGVSVTMRHCTSYTPGTFYDGTNRTGTVTLNGCAIRAGVATFVNHANATTTVVNYILSDNPGSFDTSTNPTVSATFADTTGAAAVIFTSISGEDFSLQDHANNIALGYVAEGGTTVTVDISGATRTDDDHDCGCYEVSAGGGGLTINGNLATIEIATLDGVISRGRTILGSVATMEISPVVATGVISLGRTILGNLATMEVAALSGTISRGRTILGNLATVEVAALPGTVSRGRTILGNLATMEITALQGVISFGGLTIDGNLATIEIAPLSGVISLGRTILGNLATIEIEALQGSISFGGVTEITRHAITWEFAFPVLEGSFANGDPIAVAFGGNPVRVTAITRPNAADGRDGSMVNPSRTEEAGFDDRHEDYDADLNVALDLPLDLSAGDSLVSSISDPTGHPEGAVRTWLEHCSVLTVLAEMPPANSMRPSFWGSTKTIYSADNINPAILPALEPTASVPTMASVIARIERVQMDHPAFIDLKPWANMADYGREIARDYGDALCMALCDAGEVGDKTELLIHLCQLAIDIAGAVADPGSGQWTGDGGNNHGRLAPLVLGALLLDEPGFVPDLEDGIFQEWDQYFRVVETSPGVWNNGNGGYGAEHDQMPEWGVRHHDFPSLDTHEWLNSGYRLCCTSLALWGHALVLDRVAGMQTLWQEADVFLEYAERYYEVQEPRSSDPGSFPGEEGSLTNSAFALEMYLAYRGAGLTIEGNLATMEIEALPGVVSLGRTIEGNLATMEIVALPGSISFGDPSIAELKIQVETLSNYELTDDLVLVSPASLVETDKYWEGWSLFSTFGIRTVVRKESATLAHGVVCLVYGHQGNAAALATILTKQTITLRISFNGGSDFLDTGIALDIIAGAVQHGQVIPPLAFSYNPTTGGRIGDFYVGNDDYNTPSNICIFDPVQGGYGQRGRHALRYDPARDELEEPGKGLAWNRTKVAGLFMYQGAIVRADGTYRTPAQNEQWMMSPNGFAYEGFQFSANYDLVHVSKSPIWNDQKFRTNGWRTAPDLQWMDAGVAPACMEIDRDPEKWRDPFYQLVVRQAAARWLSMIAPADEAWTGPYHGRYWEGSMRARGRILLAGVTIWRCLYKIQAIRDYAVDPQWLDMASTMATRMEEIVARQWANYVWSDTELNTWPAWRRVADSGSPILAAHPEIGASYAADLSARAWWEAGWWSHGLIWWIETVALFGPIDARAVQMLKRICIENLDQFHNWDPHPFDATNTSYRFGGWRQAYEEFLSYWKHPVSGVEYDFRPVMVPNDNVPPNTLNAVMQIGLLLGWISGTKAEEVVVKTTRTYRWDYFAKPAGAEQVVHVLPMTATAVVNAPVVVAGQLVEVPPMTARAIITGAGVNAQLVFVSPMTAYALEPTMLGEVIEVLRAQLVEVPPMTATARVGIVEFAAQEVTVDVMRVMAVMTEPLPNLQVVFVDAMVARAVMTEPSTNLLVVSVPSMVATAVSVAPSSSATLARCFAVDIDLLGNRLRNAGGIEIGMTEAERDAMLAPRDGTVIFNLDTGVLNIFHGSVWVTP